MGLALFFTFFLVFLNGFFVAAEFALVKVRASQIEIKAKTGSRVAKIAKHMTQHLDGYLAATQLGITLASLGLGWVGEEVMTKIVSNFFNLINIDMSSSVAINIGHVLAFAIITVLHIVFGELAPKSLAIQRPIGTTMGIALPLHFFYLLFRPFIWLLNGFANFILKLLGISTIGGHEAHHSSEELQYLLDQGKESGALETNEHELIKNVFDFNDRVVKNIMVPRTKISGIELNTPHKEVLDIIIREGYSRIPVYDETIDKIVGIVHAKDILPLLAENKECVLREIIRKPYFIPETKKINDLLSELQLKRIQIAIVLDEFGGTAGMVTAEDIVEELVGDIQDEYDEEKPIVEKVSANEFIIDATASIYDVNEYLPHDLPEDGDYDTVAGLVSEIFGKIPDVGEASDFNGYVITILKKADQNVESVKLELVINSEDAVDIH
ncbi:MAG: hemolysin [Sphingobacteriales bacterium 17-39-43]|uniref:hemolysin family protein n=1 Tax=Daejeonella sp. TaxID=2805397 RepID=UPI000BD4FCFF|nr:hemolysin family protein [Daejeonella sp.]OYZ27859.1 MAG: hemolysin [Sphingobacteriales bacterium 16-39-50]OZA21723.1 MAG: hemolysin [Sphingobacteriales bacterium 17-39-43]HQT24398.1 hemolysin family protein [Daejeonella sp.]HQT59002.1 hemolysin family protein [Daejeonella sp.]